MGPESSINMPSSSDPNRETPNLYPTDEDITYYAEQAALEEYGQEARGTEEFLAAIHRNELELSKKFSSDNL